jgi:hypothetical protein
VLELSVGSLSALFTKIQTCTGLPSNLSSVCLGQENCQQLLEPSSEAAITPKIPFEDNYK